MRIKEVEKATGLTAKAIRLYESKGLLTVERNTGNDYRDYSQEDVERLKTIAVLRKLEVPISEIKAWADGEAELTQLLQHTAENSKSMARKAEVRSLLAEELAAVLEKEPDQPLDQIVGKKENLVDKLKRLDEWTDWLWTDLFWPLLITMLTWPWLANTVREGLNGNLDQFYTQITGCAFLVPWLVPAWGRFLHREPREPLGWKGLAGRLLLGLVLSGCSMALLIWCQTCLLNPEAMGFLASPLWILLLLYPLGMLAVWDKRHMLRSALVHGCMYLLLLYGTVIRSVACTEEGFVRYGFWTPQTPTVYTLDLVEKVEAGFREDGEFFYELTFADGWHRDVAFPDISVDSDPWQDLQELDRRLCGLDVEKIADSQYREAFSADQQYLAICDQILTRKPK